MSSGFSQRGGLRMAPTPAGVPVAMMSPGSSVIKLERNAMVCAIEKIMRFVDSC